MPLGWVFYDGGLKLTAALFEACRIVLVNAVETLDSPALASEHIAGKTGTGWVA